MRPTPLSIRLDGTPPSGDSSGKQGDFSLKTLADSTGFVYNLLMKTLEQRAWELYEADGNPAALWHAEDAITRLHYLRLADPEMQRFDTIMRELHEEERKLGLG